VTLAGLVVRPMRASDVAAADRVFRLAFGTYLGLPDPARFGGDGDHAGTRFRADPAAAFVAELGGEVVGSNFVTTWGSVGFFGPLTVRPDLWEKGVAKALLVPSLELFEQRGVRVRGLYTFAQSAKHVRLYQRFGFWPRFLNATLSTAVSKSEERFLVLSRAGDRERELGAIRDLCGAVFPGFDPTAEVKSVLEQRLGDVVLVREGELTAFAVVHVGAGTEAGSGAAYMKVGAARSRETFGKLLDACEAFAAARGAERLRGGVHTSRLDAYRTFLERGWRTDMQGVSMLSPADGGGYDRADAFVIEDWR
jgi:predicted N-acetyltransferase YhbS